MNLIEQLKRAIALEFDKLDVMKRKVEAEGRTRTKDEVLEAQAVLDKVDELQAQLSLEERAADAAGKYEARLGVAPGRETNENPNAGAEKRGFQTFGHFLQSVIKSERSHGHEHDPRLERAASGMSEAVPSDGGFLVGTDESKDLISGVHDTARLWNKVRHIPISAGSNGIKLPGIDETSRADGSRYGGVRGYWADEAALLTKSKPKFRQIQLTLNKLIALCYLTDELVADSAALESFVMKAFQEEMGFKFDDGVINGTGVGQMLGILNAGCLVSVTKETNQVAATINKQNIEKMFTRNTNKGAAEWYMNTECWPQIFSLHQPVGAGGSPVYLPPYGLSGTPFGSILGKPVNELEQCAALGTAGDIIFANFNDYIVADKGGIQQASSIHVRFLYDENVLRFTWRLDGQPIVASALTPYKGSATTSPFVVIAIRS